ncbi:MAG TPA: alpha/beta fold hydrolase [Streptosporangiaceae bacterium]|nr:alpha/beta fold hydrolase [Streptosporangiaceae bacterium]
MTHAETAAGASPSPVSYRQPGVVLTDHTFTVPLNHDDPGGEQITLYARELTAVGKAEADLPWLLYLQGGPGHGGPRPAGRDEWLGRALEEYRVLLMDQRGTGRSTPANRQTLARLGGARAQAAYLTHFRADSIVRDAELVRGALIGDAPWSLLGQSFGGFCVVSYLSLAPEGVREAIITGGLPGLDVRADDVYRAAYQRVAARNAAHYERYPCDVDRARQVAMHLGEHQVRLPGGGPLTVEAFQTLGIMLGGSTGSHKLHYLLEDAFVDGAGGRELSDEFRYQVQAELTFASAPLYALLHEACYAQRSTSPATRWSAQRIRAEFPQFDAGAAIDSHSPVLFTGEMIYPWMFGTDPVLRPLRDAAEMLADLDSWPDLYDAARLRANQVPVAAVVYYDDMYVDREHSLRTAEVIRGLRPWVTSEYEHDGLRAEGDVILGRLIARARGET